MTGCRYGMWLSACLLIININAGLTASADEPVVSRKAGWANPPYITLSQRDAAYVNSLPVLGSIEWTLHKIPFVEEGPDAGISGAAVVRRNDTIYLAGGFIPNGDETNEPARRTSRWAYRYKIDAGVWERLPNMPGRKEYARGIAHDRGIFVVGGLSQKATADGLSAPLAEVYRLSVDGNSTQWQLHSRLNVPRTHPSAGAIGNYLIVAGGNEYRYDKDAGIIGMHASTMRDTTEVLDLAQPQPGWQIKAPIPRGPRGWSGSAVVGEKFFLFAGLKVITNSAGKQANLKLRDTLSYDPRSDEWTQHADAPFLISGWEGDVYDGRYVLLAGGVEAVAVSDEKMGQNTWNDLVFAYDTVEDRWLRLDGKMPPGGVYNDPGVVVDGETIYVAGGEGPLGSHFNHFLVGKIRRHQVADTPQADTPQTDTPQTVADDSPVVDRITRHDFTDPASKTVTPYLLYHPVGTKVSDNGTPASSASKTKASDKHSLVIFLYGAGGSLNGYNIRREPYALLRAQLAKRGYYILIPDLGKRHFMNDAAKATLDGIVAEVLKQQQIASNRVHVMGTSMGGGSSLAYAIHRPDLIRSVCAVMPMTDFAAWVQENQGYEKQVAAAFGGTRQQIPAAYDRNSAVKRIDAFEKIPVMLVHGNRDHTVLYRHSQELADLLHKKQFHCVLYTADGQGHKDEVMRNFQLQAADFFDAAAK